MVHPGLKKWAQNVGDLRLLSLKAPHPRSQEQFQAMYIWTAGKVGWFYSM